MNFTYIDWQNINFYPSLVQDYFSGKLKQKSIVNWDYSIEEILKKRESKNFLYRKELVAVLKEQYQGITSSPLSKINIELLLSDNTFTITTGHQLCIYGGPAYFFSKIIDTIKLCEDLKKKDSKNNYIPIFWLASEDHDFEEISSINWFNQTLKWESRETGAVGNFSTQGLSELNDIITSNFGSKELDEKVKVILLEAFNSTNSLSTAIRILVNELLGKYGVVILDGNHPNLKALFAPYAVQEIKESFCFQAVSEKIEQLDGYKIQANPRVCNLFYLDKNYRERLEIKDNNIITADSLNSWKTADFIQKIKQNPEIISPNVLLRPLYQEIVLPNLAYIGGAGEISYWLELSEMFAKVKVQFPVPVVRNSYLYIKGKQLQQIQNLNLNLEDFFLREDLLIKSFIEKISDTEFSLSEEKETLASLFEALEKRAVAIDVNLSKVVKGESVKTLSSLDHLEKRFRNAEKSKYDSQIKNIQQIREKIFPNGVFQEREISLLELMIKSDTDVFESLLKSSKPLDNSIQIIEY